MALAPDQYRFLLANVVGISLALPYKLIPKSLRNEYNYIPGLCMLYYCFGRQANLLILYSAVSYAICRFGPKRQVHRITLVTSLAFLSYAHLSRQIIDYGGYVLDISGPFMIAVQKMTSLGFCMFDGYVRQIEKISDTEKKLNNQYVSPAEVNNNDSGFISPKSVKSAESMASTSSVVGATVDIINKPLPKSNRLTDEQRRYAVSKVPNFNEFMGYFFHFPSVLCGPIMWYTDYLNFVQAPEDKPTPPGRLTASAQKLAISVSCAILHLSLNPKFDVDFLRSPEFLIHTPLLVRFYYIFIFTVLSRLKYYVAWHLGETISNLTGFGFNGFDANGNPRWNLISNMELWKFETSTSLRDALHSWNKTTQSWLRRIAYERAPRKLAVLSTYLLSAIWHGFYPGYYMTFLGGALFTHAARNGRRVFRPMFQKSPLHSRVYDCITFVLTRFVIAYAAFPFVILDFRNSYEIYKSLYFSIHILAIGGALLGFIPRRK